MTVAPIESLSAMIEDEVTRRSEVRIKETMAELLGSIAREYGLQVVPHRGEVKVPAHVVKQTPATEKLLDFTAFDRAIARHDKHIKNGLVITPAGKRAKSDIIREGNLLHETFGVSCRALSIRAGRSVNWFSILRHKSGTTTTTSLKVIN